MGKKKKNIFEPIIKNKLLLVGIIIAFFVSFNVITINYFFNSTLKKNNPKLYRVLEKNTKIKLFGVAALNGKKITSHKKIYELSTVPDVTKARSSSHTKTFFTEAVIGLCAYLLLKKKKFNTDDGSARWGGYEDIITKTEKDKIFGLSLINDEGVILGQFNRKKLFGTQKITLRDNAKTHICVTAPTRTGKGVSLIIPTLTKGWRESTVVLDIKGENYQLTSGARKELWNNKILRFAPKSDISSSFNPLAEIRFLQEQEQSDVSLITDIITADDSAKDKFWSQASAEFFTGIIFFVMMKKFLQNPTFIVENGIKKPVSTANLSDISDFITDPENAAFENEDGSKTGIQAALLHYANEVDLIEEYGKDEETKNYVRNRLLELYPLEADIINKGMHPKYAREFAAKGATSEQTFGSIMATAKVAIRVFEIPVVKRNTSTSDFRINDIMNFQDPVALYLVVPPADIITLKPLIKILLVQIVTLLTGEMDYTNQSGHRWRNLMLLDEFPAVGKIEIIEEAIGYLAGYGIKLMVILQSLDQLYKIYKKENGILSNCQTQVFYTSNDDTTSQYVSKLLGDTTLVRTKTTRNLGSQGGSKSIETKKRPLLMPDEVGRFPIDKIIVKIAAKNPLETEKIVYFKEPEYRDLTKIPYIYPESCYDKKRQYIKLTDEQKKLYPEYPYNYLPYVGALKMMKKDLKELERIIIMKERKNSTDPKEIDDLRSKKEIFEKQDKGFKVYMKMFNLINKNFPEVFEEERKEEKMKKEKTGVTRDIQNEEKTIIKQEKKTIMEEIEKQILGDNVNSSLKLNNPDEEKNEENKTTNEPNVENEKEKNTDLENPETPKEEKDLPEYDLGDEDFDKLAGLGELSGLDNIKDFSENDLEKELEEIL